MSLPDTPSQSPSTPPMVSFKQDLPPSPESPTVLLSSRFAQPADEYSRSSSSSASPRARHASLYPLTTISDEALSDPQDHTVQNRGRLFLSIDSGTRKVRACVLDERLHVVWMEQVDVDRELPEYGTRNGVYTIDSEVVCPSELRIKAVDLLLDKLSNDCPDETLLGRVVAISGATPSNHHLLSHSFPGLLELASYSTSAHLPLSSIFTSSTAFSLPTPPTRSDTSTAPQIREIELSVGSPPPTPAPTPATPSSNGHSEHENGNSGSEAPRPSRPRGYQELTALKSGRARIADRTGGVIDSGSLAAQLMKLRQRDEATAVMAEAEGEGNDDQKVQGSDDGSQEDHQDGVLDRTSRICTESALLGSLLIGRLAPTEASDAASTALYNLTTGDWDQELLSVVMGDDEPSREFFEGEQTGAERLRGMLGEVCTDGGRPLGKVSGYLVERFGFSPDCLVFPFTTDHASSYLAYPLGDRDVALHLGVDDSDCLLVPCSKYVPSVEEGRTIVPHPALSTGQDVESKWIAMLPAKEAGLGRALARDLYCNNQWSVFSRLVAVSSHGGSIGLDSKSFSFFFPRGLPAGTPQGFSRFVSGSRVAEYEDRKVNPRLLLESEFLSFRFRLGRLYLALSCDDSSATSLPTSVPTSLTSPHDALRFPPHSSNFIPHLLLLYGAPAANAAIVSLSSTVLGSPAVFVNETTDMVRSRTGQLTTGQEESYKTTSSALGAAYKAAWGYARAKGWGGEGSAMLVNGELSPRLVEKDPRSFSRFISEVSLSTRAMEEQEEHQRVETDGRTRGRSPRNRDRDLIIGLAEDHEDIASRMHDSSLGDSADQAHLGITLVAEPDPDEFKFYSSMLREHVRLETTARRNLI